MSTIANGKAVLSRAYGRWGEGWHLNARRWASRHAYGTLRPYLDPVIMVPQRETRTSVGTLSADDGTNSTKPGLRVRSRPKRSLFATHRSAVKKAWSGTHRGMLLGSFSRPTAMAVGFTDNGHGRGETVSGKTCDLRANTGQNSASQLYDRLPTTTGHVIGARIAKDGHEV
jgi:hypothetical protein